MFALFAASTARAQSRTGFAVNRFEPAERGGGWFVVDALDLRGEARPALGVTVDYAYKPLVVYDSAQTERAALVRHQFFAHLGGSLVLWERLRIGIDVPVAAYQDGEGALVGGDALKAATSPAFGDLRLAADARAVGRFGDPLALALGVRVWLPTGLRSQFTSDGSARVAPQLLASGGLGRFSWAARAAFVIRTRDDDYAGSALGSELAGAVGVGVHAGGFFVGPEVFASTVATGQGSFLSTHATPADAILGAHYELASGLHFGAGLGSGLTHGYGSPLLRVLASVEWSPPVPFVAPDRDHDGVPDATDACVDVPGVRSSDPEENGCPAGIAVPREDTDHDGVFDSDDACPTIPGVRTADERTNGCPAESAPQPLAIVTDTEIKIEEKVAFARDSADILAESDPVLWAVKRSLDKHPEIRKLRVEGHTDDTGDGTYNEDLSRRRAASVTQWLVAHGVESSRLLSEGFGAKKPIASNDTEDGRAKNRRVAFTIVERTGPAR